MCWREFNQVNKIVKLILMYMKIRRKLDLKHWEEVQVLKSFISILSLLPSREPRGFGFVQYVDPDDAADAKYHMDGQLLLGRELTVVFAEENRKKPSEMRARERYRRSPIRYSGSPCYTQTYSRSPDYYSPSPRRRRYSGSISAGDRRDKERSYSRSPYYSRSQSRSISRSSSRWRSQSLDYSRWLSNTRSVLWCDDMTK